MNPASLLKPLRIFDVSNLDLSNRLFDEFCGIQFDHAVRCGRFRAVLKEFLREMGSLLQKVKSQGVGQRAFRRIEDGGVKNGPIQRM